MISKVILFVSFMVYVNAGDLLGAHSYGPALPHAPSSYAVNTGHSSVSRSQDVYGNYMFGYNAVGHLGDTKSRFERRDAAGNVIGSYTINDIDGRARRVDYTADAFGFRANVATNEPGTKPSFSGDALVNGGQLEAPLVAAGPAIPHAPLPAAPVISSFGFAGIAPHAMTYGPALGPNRYDAPYAGGAY